MRDGNGSIKGLSAAFTDLAAGLNTLPEGVKMEAIAEIFQLRAGEGGAAMIQKFSDSFGTVGVEFEKFRKEMIAAAKTSEWLDTSFSMLTDNTLSQLKLMIADVRRELVKSFDSGALSDLITSIRESVASGGIQTFVDTVLSLGNALFIVTKFAMDFIDVMVVFAATITGLKISAFIAGVLELITVGEKAKFTILGLNAAMLSNPYVLAGAAIAGVATGLYLAHKNAKEAAESQEAWNKQVRAAADGDALDKLLSKVKKLQEERERKIEDSWLPDFMLPGKDEADIEAKINKYVASIERMREELDKAMNDQSNIDQSQQPHHYKNAGFDIEELKEGLRQTERDFDSYVSEYAQWSERATEILYNNKDRFRKAFLKSLELPSKDPFIAASRKLMLDVAGAFDAMVADLNTMLTGDYIPDTILFEVTPKFDLINKSESITALQSGISALVSEAEATLPVFVVKTDFDTLLPQLNKPRVSAKETGYDDSQRRAAMQQAEELAAATRNYDLERRLSIIEIQKLEAADLPTKLDQVTKLAELEDQAHQGRINSIKAELSAVTSMNSKHISEKKKAQEEFNKFEKDSSAMLDSDESKRLQKNVDAAVAAASGGSVKQIQLQTSLMKAETDRTKSRIEGERSIRDAITETANYELRLASDKKIMDLEQERLKSSLLPTKLAQLEAEKTIEIQVGEERVQRTAAELEILKGLKGDHVEAIMQKDNDLLDLQINNSSKLISNERAIAAERLSVMDDLWRRGNVSVEEYQAAVSEALNTTAVDKEEHDRLMVLSGNDALAAMKLGFSDWAATVQSDSEFLVDAVGQVADHIGSGLADAFQSMAEGSKTAKEAMMDLARSTISMVAQMIAQQLIYNAIKGAGLLAMGAADGGLVPQKLASGGTVRGSSPHPRADNIPANLTAGEFVQPVRAVDHYGVGFMESIRNLSYVPTAKGYADGGGISAPSEPTVYKGGDTKLKVVNVLDKGLVTDYMNTVAGETTLINMIRRNGSSIRTILGA
jgi:hypothetical protein